MRAPLKAIFIIGVLNYAQYRYSISKKRKLEVVLSNSSTNYRVSDIHRVLALPLSRSLFPFSTLYHSMLFMKGEELYVCVVDPAYPLIRYAHPCPAHLKYGSSPTLLVEHQVVRVVEDQHDRE
jgi:hypothetical protein